MSSAFGGSLDESPIKSRSCGVGSDGFDLSVCPKQHGNLYPREHVMPRRGDLVMEKKRPSSALMSSKRRMGRPRFLFGSHVFT